MTRFLVAVAALWTATAVPAQTRTIGFESFGVPPGGYLNNAGGGANGYFTEQGAALNNRYSFFPGFGDVWSGWALSRVVDTTTPGFGNQYASIAGGGSRGSSTYAVAFTFGGDIADPVRPDGSFIDLPDGFRPFSIDVSNTTYAYHVMREGDAFFGEPAFGPGDFLKLTVTGYTGLGGVGAVTDSVDFYLADYRAGQTLLRNNWNTVDLTTLGDARSLRFALESSSFGSFGINTPAYFALDHLVVNSVPEPSAGALVLAAAGAACAWRRRRRA